MDCSTVKKGWMPMSKVKETIKIILVVAVLAVGVFFGVNYL
ncbi:ethanolamine utilization protein EutQ, partial [Lactiplantibacillus plantarum]|nr:ethanolamine utilization protein EutQ [Lactiplantibacillus plantarum]